MPARGEAGFLAPMTRWSRQEALGMPETRLGGVRLALIVAMAAATLGPGLGGSGRLTYHEAFVAQGRRR